MTEEACLLTPIKWHYVTEGTQTMFTLLDPVTQANTIQGDRWSLQSSGPLPCGALQMTASILNCA